MSLTEQQIKSLNLYCDQLANALNDAGYDMKKVFEVRTMDIPWSKERVKENLWKDLQETMFGKRSTMQLEKMEVTEVYETLNRFTASNFGVSVPFPSKDLLQ